MPIGTVKWFDNRKGWGFVVQPDGSDLFVHYTSIQGGGFRRLDEGDKVEYEVTDGPKGKQAGNVQVIESARQRKKDLAAAAAAGGREGSNGQGGGESPDPMDAAPPDSGEARPTESVSRDAPFA